MTLRAYDLTLNTSVPLSNLAQKEGITGEQFKQNTSCDVQQTTDHLKSRLSTACPLRSHSSGSLLFLILIPTIIASNFVFVFVCVSAHNSPLKHHRGTVQRFRSFWRKTVVNISYAQTGTNPWRTIVSWMLEWLPYRAASQWVVEFRQIMLHLFVTTFGDYRPLEQQSIAGDN